MKILLGVPEIGWGLYVLVRHKRFAVLGARFHQRIAEAIPSYARGNRNVSDEAWRYMAPAIGVFMITVGILILIFVPLN
jgi:hypothetical protein